MTPVTLDMPMVSAGAGAPTPTAAAPSSSSFNSVLRREAARLVSSALVLPALESMRQSPLAGGPMAPGFAERRFMPLLDQHMADRITRSRGFGLVDSIVQRLAGSVGSMAARGAAGKEAS
jgi:Rod binding domain-containing protein